MEITNTSEFFKTVFYVESINQIAISYLNNFLAISNSETILTTSSTILTHFREEDFQRKGFDITSERFHSEPVEILQFSPRFVDSSAELLFSLSFCRLIMSKVAYDSNIIIDKIDLSSHFIGFSLSYSAALCLLNSSTSVSVFEYNDMKLNTANTEDFFKTSDSISIILTTKKTKNDLVVILMKSGDVFTSKEPKTIGNLEKVPLPTKLISSEEEKSNHKGEVIEFILKKYIS